MARPEASRTTLTLLAFALALLCALTGSAREARAQSSLDLTWTAPAGCPDRAWVIAGVQRLVATAPPQTLRVTAAAREEDGRWVVELEMQGAASGKRTLRAASCMSVARATALLVALALDPQAAAHASDESAGGERPLSEPTDREPQVKDAVKEPPPPPPPPPPTKPAPREEVPSPPPAPGLRPIVFVGVGAERVFLPGVVAGASIGAGIVWRGLRADLAAQLAPWGSASLARLPSIGADFVVAALALRACAGGSFSWWVAVHGCAALRGARVSGEGTGLAESYRQTAWLMALEPGVLLRVPGRTRAALELDVAAVLPATRPDFVILARDSSEQLFRVSAIGARGALAASVRF